MRQVFQLQDDDDEPETKGGAGKRGNARGSKGGASSSSASGAASAAAAPPLRSKVWLRVYSDGANDPVVVSVYKDEPLSASGVVAEAAKRLYLDASRTKLYRTVEDLDDPQDVSRGALLDLTRTALQLGLVPDAGSKQPLAVWAEETAEATITLKLVQGTGGRSKEVGMTMAPSATFASLLTRYCAEHGGGTTPAQLKITFDGDALSPDDTPAGKELEDGDMLEVCAK